MSQRATRSRAKPLNVFHKWQYKGNGEENVTCRAKAGDTLHDDMDIILPNGKKKKDRTFIFQSMTNNCVHGYYMHKGQKVSVKRTASHIYQSCDVDKLTNLNNEVNPIRRSARVKKQRNPSTDTVNNNNM